MQLQDHEAALAAFLAAITQIVREIDRMRPEDRTTERFAEQLDSALDLQVHELTPGQMAKLREVQRAFHLILSR